MYLTGSRGRLIERTDAGLYAGFPHGTDSRFDFRSAYAAEFFRALPPLFSSFIDPTAREAEKREIAKEEGFVPRIADLLENRECLLVGAFGPLDPPGFPVQARQVPERNSFRSPVADLAVN